MKTAESVRFMKLLAADRYSSEEARRAHELVENVLEARACGFEFACPECGIGVSDDSDEHASWCTAKEQAEQALAAFADRLSGLQRDDTKGVKQ